jgi:hypothetical protein
LPEIWIIEGKNCEMDRNKRESKSHNLRSEKMKTKQDSLVDFITGGIQNQDELKIFNHHTEHIIDSAPKRAKKKMHGTLHNMCDNAEKFDRWK